MYGVPRQCTNLQSQFAVFNGWVMFRLQFFLSSLFFYCMEGLSVFATLSCVVCGCSMEFMVRVLPVAVGC